MFKELEITGTGVGLITALLALGTVAIILFFKRKYRQYDAEALASAHKDQKSDLSGRTKFPEVDVFKWSGSFLNYGLTDAMALSLVTMSWTEYEKKIDIPLDDFVYEDEVEVEIPRTAEPPPPPPPPTEDIFKVVEQMPRFPGCEDMGGTDKEKEDCAKKKLLEFIYGNLKYPAIARENGVEGNVVLQFVVDRDGSVKDIKIVRDIGAGCGTAAKAAVNSMNTMGKKWTPGKQLGRPVKVVYTLPIRFKLEG